MRQAQSKLLGINRRKLIDTLSGRYLTRFEIPEVDSELVRLLYEELELAEDSVSVLEDTRNDPSRALFFSCEQFKSTQ